MQRDKRLPRMVHNTRPLDRSPLALADNPLGTAAWILEKLHDWSDVGGNIEYRYSKDQLITAVMIYLVTETIDTSIWMYRGSVDENVQIPAGRRVTVPTACAAFPKEFLPWPPRSRIRRTFDLQRYTEMPAGGFFQPWKNPWRSPRTSDPFSVPCGSVRLPVGRPPRLSGNPRDWAILPR